MKIIAIFLLAITVAFSQNMEPIQTELETNLPKRQKFNYVPLLGPMVNEYLSGSTQYFKLENMTLGFHWGGQRKISKAMLINQSDMTTAYSEYTNPDYYNNGTNLFVRAKWSGGDLYTHAKYDDEILFTKSLRYSAALPHDPVDDYKLIKLANDPENNIFGFKYKHPNCTPFQFPDNKWRLKVEDNVPANTVILRDPWPSRMMYYVL